MTQFHLGELARAQNAPARARDHYLDALSLAGGPPPLRQKAKEALAALQAGTPSAGFDAWLDTELTRRRDDRKRRHSRAWSTGRCRRWRSPRSTAPYDTSGLRGKVLLLNFFASW